MSHKTAATVAHTFGIDTGKNILHLIGIDDKGSLVVRMRFDVGAWVRNHESICGAFVRATAERATEARKGAQIGSPATPGTSACWAFRDPPSRLHGPDGARI